MASAKPELPGIITAITTQKRNSSRYSVFVDEQFLIGVADETLMDNNLKKGVEMTPSLYKKLQRQEGRHAVRSYVLKILSRRDHARRELYNKAMRKEDFTGDVINDVLDEMEAKDYLNEERFAAVFARDKCNLNRWGPVKIKTHLLQKGVDKQTGQQAVDEVFREVDLWQRFSELIEKKRRRFLREEDAFKRKKKVFDYLQRKGYYPGSIYRHLDELMQMLDE